MDDIDNIQIEGPGQNMAKMPKQLYKEDSIDCNGKNLSKNKDNQQQKENEPPLRLMIRSNSECLLRDKEFYEMQDEDDEIAMYCKFTE